MYTSTAFIDNGFSNIGVRPTDEDLGLGGEELGKPLSFTRQALEEFPFAPELPECGGPDQEDCPPGYPADPKVQVDGAFKIPGLRNVELTAPYMHNGGLGDLEQVIEFYDRHGDFADMNIDNVDRNMALVVIEEGDEEFLEEFLLALTDDRVRDEAGPFDHPQLFVPNGHPGDENTVDCFRQFDNGVKQACDDLTEIPAVGTKGNTAKGTPPLRRFLSQR